MDGVCETALYQPSPYTIAMLLQSAMIKIAAAAVVLVLMLCSGIAGYWLCNRQIEESFLIANVSDAISHLALLDAAQKKDFAKAIDFHDRVFETDLAVISNSLHDRPDLEAPIVDKLRQRIAKYNDEHPDFTVQTLPRPANP
jgi:hypothetical protein